MSITIFGEKYIACADLPVGNDFEPKNFLKIDLSANNPDLHQGKTDDVEGLQAYIFGLMDKAGAKVAYGGYAEKRDLYQRSRHFSSQAKFRSIHLGIDFWAPAGTVVKAPIPGRVHSFKDNANPGDYGPCIILEHFIENQVIHSLYGHLSRESLANLEEGRIINRGETIGRLGTPDENLGWPPHLHFQLIKDIGDSRGDYIGVCFKKDKKYYLKNCPDPVNFFESAVWRSLGS